MRNKSIIILTALLSFSFFLKANFEKGFYSYKITGDNEVEINLIKDTIIENLVIPSVVIHENITYHVKKIGHGFKQLYQLKSIVFPNSISRIPSTIFSQNKYLQHITLGENTEIIEDGAFFECINLESILFNNKLKIIGNHALAGCSNLNKIQLPDSLEKVGEMAFMMTSIDSLNIPQRITYIGKNALSGCDSLKYIHVHPDNPAYKTQENVLFNKNMTHLIKCAPKKAGYYYIPDCVKKIDNFAFSACEKLIPANIPKSLEIIETETFDGFTDLTKVYIPSTVKKIEVKNFIRCPSLQNIEVDPLNKYYLSLNGVLYTKDTTNLVKYPSGRTGSFTLPENVKKITEYAFNQAVFLTSVTLSDSLQNIGRNAFKDCSSLTSVSMGKNVCTIDEGTFASCINLKDINLPPGLKNISHALFLGCKSLRSINIPESVERIENTGFYNCISLQYITLPYKLEYIGGNAFASCTSLKEIFIPVNVIYIGKGAFNDAISMEKIKIHKDNLIYSSEDGILLSKNKTKLIFYPDGKKGNYKIPTNIISIQEYAFNNNPHLKELTISERVTDIHENAFYKSLSLEKLNVIDENPLFSSYEGVLFNKNRTILHKYPAGKKNKIYHIPCGVTGIKTQSFDNNPYITGIIFPKTIQTIEYHIFNFNTSLSDIYFTSSTAPRIGLLGITGFGNKTLTIHVPENSHGYTSEEGWHFIIKEQNETVKYNIRE